MNEAFDFDQALALQSVAEGRFAGHTHEKWQNMVGPFGGITAAVMLQALMLSPERLGEPLSLTVNFCAGVAPGPFEITLKAARTNRSTQHWQMELSQDGLVVNTATAVTAVRRATWSATEAVMPSVPAASALAQVPHAPQLAWTNRYDLRYITGALPTVLEGATNSSLSQLWVRDVQQRPLDFAALTALADVFFPRVYVARARIVPIGTVAMTVYFHADLAALGGVGAGFLLGQAVALRFVNGFFDQTAQLWSEAGTLLVSSTQLVYFKN